MGMTIAEKIIAAAAGVDSVKPGDIHTVTLDRMMSNDGTTHLTVDMYNNKLKNPRIADPKKLVFIVDHNVPSRYEKIYGFLELPDTPEEKVGSLRHPGEKSHGYAAEVIVSYLEEQLICQK